MITLPVYEVKAEHIPLTRQSDQIDLGNWVIGLRIRFLQDSTATDLLFGIDEAPRIPLNVADMPAEYGPFQINGVHCVYRGLFQYRFVQDLTALKGNALLIITRLVPVPVEDLTLTVCE